MFVYKYRSIAYDQPIINIQNDTNVIIYIYYIYIYIYYIYIKYMITSIQAGKYILLYIYFKSFFFTFHYNTFLFQLFKKIKEKKNNNQKLYIQIDYKIQHSFYL